METKSEIRKLIKCKREALLSQDKEAFDDVIYDKIVSSEQYNKCNILFIYVSFGMEVDTHRIIKHALDNNKIVCVPKIISKAEGMIAVRIKSMEDLSPGKYGILEPRENNDLINENRIELIILPGIAYDNSKFRVGYGGGFYDRFLDKVSMKTYKLGIAYKFQLFTKVPTEDFDKPVDLVITN